MPSCWDFSVLILKKREETIGGWMKLELEVGLLFCDFVPCFLFFFISCALLLVISLLAGLYWADFTKRTECGRTVVFVLIWNRWKGVSSQWLFYSQSLANPKTRLDSSLTPAIRPEIPVQSARWRRDVFTCEIRVDNDI